MHTFQMLATPRVLCEVAVKALRETVSKGGIIILNMKAMGEDRESFSQIRALMPLGLYTCLCQLSGLCMQISNQIIGSRADQLF